jgi:hypothetical protein
MTSEQMQSLIAKLTPREFEVLVRGVIKKELAGLGQRQGSISLNIHVEYGEDPTAIKNADWAIGDYGSSTKGEILHEVVHEHNRRMGFTEACKLQVLEYEPPVAAPAPADGDEIPF